MQALESTPAWQSKEEADDDLSELPCKKVTSAAALPDIADLDNENHIQTTDKAVAVSSAVKSYAAVTKASVVTAARPHLAHIYSDTPPRLLAALRRSCQASRQSTSTPKRRRKITQHPPARLLYTRLRTASLPAPLAA